MPSYDFECQPIIAWLNVNQACNMRCKWCYASNSAYNPNVKMSIQTALELIDTSIAAGVQEFVLIGGEPTLWPHLFEVIRYIHGYDRKVSIITNALRFSNDEFWESYLGTPADSLGISVKSTTPELFELATGISKLDDSLIGIKRALDYHQCGVSAVYNTLIGIDGLLDIARTCKRLGAKSFQMVICTPTFNATGDIAKGYSFDPITVARDTPRIASQLESIYGDKVNFDLQLPLCLFPRDFICRLLQEHRLQTQCHVFSRGGVNFDTDGNVMICNEVTEVIARRNSDFVNGESLLEALNTPTMKTNYEELCRYPSSECSNCDWQDDCRGGCLMNWFLYEPTELCRAVS